MHRSGGSRPHSYHESHMYDDRDAERDQYRRDSSHYDRQDSRKDYSNTPYRGPASDRDIPTGPSDRGSRKDYDSGYAYQRDRFRENSRSPRRDGRRRYYDRDREGYRSPRHDQSRSRSRSRSPYHGPPPNRTIILEGLPMNITQEDISNELQHTYNAENLEEIRLIKDKKTGLSRQFAFAQFVSVDDARRFFERNYPSIDLPSRTQSTGEAVKVRIAYSRDKDDTRPGLGEDDWKCEICFISNYAHRVVCFRCNAPRTRSTATGVVGVITQPAMSTFSGFSTTGDSDVSPDNTASQFLLFRGLEPGVNEELLAKGAAKLYKSSPVASADPGAPKKNKITSTSSESNFGAKEGSLRRVLLVRDRKSNESWRYGFAEFSTVEEAQAAMAKFNALEKFTISSKPVMVSYIHAGVFVPVLHAPATGFDKFAFSPLSNPAMKLMYWDEAAYVNELVTQTVDQLAQVNQKESAHAKAATAAANEGLLSTPKESDAKSKKRKAEKDPNSTSKKVVAPHLQFWTNRHAELHGLPQKNEDEQEEDGSEEVRSHALAAAKATKAASDQPPSRSYADLSRKCCLLCSRQFKTEAEVHKHERISQLHRDNMQNEELKSKAIAKLEKAGITAPDSDSPAYRDRAKERRQAFNQPKQPAAQHNKPPKDANASTKETNEEEPAPAVSKGASLLGKMGWTAGEGLGAQGTGRTDAIATDIYAQGVGLGAVGGKIGDAVEEADRSTRGSYADFVSKSKEKAKERFESMS